MAAAFQSLKDKTNDLAAQVKGAVAQAQTPAPPPIWSTKECQTHDIASDHLWFGCCCFQCAGAKAKSNVDKSHPCVNCLCWIPAGSRSFVRLAYGIEGTCGDDMGYGTFAMCCTSRQIYTEAAIRGPLSGPYGTAEKEWKHSLFDCTAGEFCQAVFCCFCVSHEVRTIMQPEAGKSCWFDSLCTLPTAMYGQVRNTYGLIPDHMGAADDVFVAGFCCPCALNRARKEAQHQRSEGSLVHNVANTLLGAQGARIAEYGMKNAK